MADAGCQGLEGLITCLGEQQLLRGTGVISVGDGAHIYVVFGHPLHAVSADTTGLEAVDVAAECARREPQSPVVWTAGVTSGRAHSLSPSDGVIDRVRRFESGETSAWVDAEMTVDRIEDLGLRRLMAEMPAAGRRPEIDARPWESQKAAICASFEAGLHRHARQLVEAVQMAEPEPRSILRAIDNARSLTIRAVSPARVAALLDAAEAGVRESASSTWPMGDE